MLLLMSLSHIAPTSDLGKSMLLLSSLVAPNSERGESVVVLLSLSLSLSLSLLLSLSLSLSLSFAVDAPSSAGQGMKAHIRSTDVMSSSFSPVVMHSSLFQGRERRRASSTPSAASSCGPVRGASRPEAVGSHPPQVTLMNHDDVGGVRLPR